LAPWHVNFTGIARPGMMLGLVSVRPSPPCAANANGMSRQAASDVVRHARLIGAL